MKIRDIVRPLLQEIYQPDGWKMLTCCMLLNLTNRKQVDTIFQNNNRKLNPMDKVLQEYLRVTQGD